MIVGGCHQVEYVPVVSTAAIPASFQWLLFKEVPNERYNRQARCDVSRTHLYVSLRVLFHNR